MKNLNFIFILSLNSLVFGQYLEIEYSGMLRQKLSEEDKQDILEDNEYGREQIKMNEEPDSVAYKMLISGKESSFTYIEKISNEQDVNKPKIIQSPGGFGTTYHNLATSESRQDFTIYSKKYYSVDPLEKWDWKIIRESKKMMGYELRKATAENQEFTITAWYAPTLNISNGPAQFWGLPGLIFEVEQVAKEYPVQIKYSLQSIKTLNKAPKIIAPNKGEQIKISEVEGLYETANKQLEESYNNPNAVDKD